MTTVVRVNTNTLTLSVTHVAYAMIGVFQAVVTELGLSPAYIHQNWEPLEEGLTTWLGEQTLQAAHLEIFTPAGQPVTRLDLQVAYGSFLDDDRKFYSDIAAAKLALRKVGVVPRSCLYRIVVSRGAGYTRVPGWFGTTLLPTESMRCRVVGDLIGSPDIRSNLRIWIR